MDLESEFSAIEQHVFLMRAQPDFDDLVGMFVDGDGALGTQYR